MENNTMHPALLEDDDFLIRIEWGIQDTLNQISCTRKSFNVSVINNTQFSIDNYLDIAIKDSCNHPDRVIWFKCSDDNILFNVINTLKVKYKTLLSNNIILNNKQFLHVNHEYSMFLKTWEKYNLFN